MTARATISFDDDNYLFLNQHAGKNRSAYINDLLRRERQRTLEDGLLRANLEERDDPDYQAELSEWDVTLADGLLHEA